MWEKRRLHRLAVVALSLCFLSMQVRGLNGFQRRGGAEKGQQVLDVRELHGRLAGTSITLRL